TFVDDTVETYSDYSSQNYSQAEGLTSYVSGLPSFFHGPTNFFISQINPFPFTRGIHVVGETTKKAPSLDKDRIQYLSFSRGIGALFWYFILYFTIKYLRKGRYLKVDRNASYVFLFALSVLFVTTF